MTGLVGTIAIAVCVLLPVLFWPAYGLYWRWMRYRELGQRVLVEDALKHFHNCEFEQLAPTVDSLSGALQIGRGQAVELIGRLESMGLVTTVGPRWGLTSPGRKYALRIIRAHRLLETYMAERTGLPETHWHGEADRREHFLTADEVDALAAAMAHPRYDPHGDPIPTAAGEVAPARGVALTTLSSGQSAVVTHVEDEPDVIYKQLTAQGFSMGSQLSILEATPQSFRVEVEGEEQILASIVAANLTVLLVDPGDRQQELLRRLSEVPLGDAARVVRISPACRGVQRRRLFDLGLIPGTVVRAEFRGPGGDPTAYDIRGARIALRRQQADQILVAADPPGEEAVSVATAEAG